MPDVTLALAGFVAHLDVHSYDLYDGLSPNKFVRNVTLTGFDISAPDLSEGMVEVKYVYCSWMACQELTEEISFYSK